MNAKSTPNPGTNRKRNSRLGLLQAEVLVAASLLSTVIGLLTCIGYQVQRVAKDTQQYQVALHELANQMDRLTILPIDSLSEQLKDLRVSEPTARSLNKANLASQVVADANGTRLVLALQWERIGQPQPVQLVGWIDTDSVEGNR
jgi:Tfp pilus assembly protein PilV